MQIIKSRNGWQTVDGTYSMRTSDPGYVTVLRSTVGLPDRPEYTEPGEPDTYSIYLQYGEQQAALQTTEGVQVLRTAREFSVAVGQAVEAERQAREQLAIETPTRTRRLGVTGDEADIEANYPGGYAAYLRDERHSI